MKKQGYDVTGWEFNSDGSIKFASTLSFRALPMDNHGIALRFEYQPTYKPGQSPLLPEQYKSLCQRHKRPSSLNIFKRYQMS